LGLRLELVFGDGNSSLHFPRVDGGLLKVLINLLVEIRMDSLGKSLMRFIPLETSFGL